MARPTKTGLEYFPLDVDMDQDDKLFFIEAKHGLIGFAVVVRLLMLIYKDGYYKQYTEDKEAFMLAKRLSVEVNVLNNIINDCINEDIFNKKLFEQYGILTSRGIQKRYLEACARRKEVNIFKEYCLIDPKNYKNLVFEYINPVIVDINPDKCNTVSAETPQSKVKESKEKESKEKNNTRAREEKKQPKKIKFADFVSLTNAEYEALVAKLGVDGAKRCIEILDNYKGAKGKKYKSDYRAILNWVVERYEEEKLKKQHNHRGHTIPQKNFEQREYGSEFYDGFFDNKEVKV